MRQVMAREMWMFGLAAVATGAGLAVAVMLYINTPHSTPRNRKRLDSRSYTLDSGVGDKAMTTTTVKPPFPTEITHLLKASSLCYLSTAQNEEESSQPHLSLMNFTYYKEEEVIIMTTRRDTRKLTNLITNPQVALLLHDFPQRNEIDKNGGKTFSITLYGLCSIQEQGSSSEKLYRKLHLERNPDYKQFIEGDNIAVLTTRIDKASICNIKDEVKHWNAADSGTAP